MLIGSQIEHCPFIPFVIPHPRTADYKKISNVLKSDDQPPNLIFLAKKSFEEPPHLESVKIHILRFNNIGGKNATYFDFLDLVFSIIANSTKTQIPFIGVASRSSPDFSEFFIVRWLRNECDYKLQDALTLVKFSLSPGITKAKYLHQLARLTSTSENLINPNLDIDINPKNQSKKETQASSLLNIISSDSPINTDDESANSHHAVLNEQISVDQNEQKPIIEEKPNNVEFKQSISIQIQPDTQSTARLPSTESNQLSRLRELQIQYKQMHDYYSELQNHMNQFKMQPRQYQQANYVYQSNLTKKLYQTYSQLIQMNSEIELLQKENEQESFHKTKEQRPERISIEKAIAPQHSQQYLNEITTLLNVPNFKCLFPNFKMVTSSLYDDLKRDMRNEQCEICLMPEPQGERAILYLRRKVPIVIYQKYNIYTPIELSIDLNVQENEIFIFEIVFVRLTYNPSIIVLCDLLYFRNEDVSAYEFNYRIGMLQECFSSIFNNSNESIQFAIRPFYKLSDYQLLTRLFERNPKQKFVHYPLVGISVTAVSSRNEHRGLCMFLWTPYIIENPRVIIRVNVGSKSVYGSLQAGISSVMEIYLGKLNPELLKLDGKVAEIRVVNKNPLYPNLIYAQIIGLSHFDVSDPRDQKKAFPWSVKKFRKHYPNGEPNLGLNQLNQLFAII